jgi:hypothetical protein
MDGHHMFPVYGTLIIGIIYRSYLISRKTTWYHSESGLDSLAGGPRSIRREL